MAKPSNSNERNLFTDIDLQIMLCNEKDQESPKIYRKSEKNVWLVWPFWRWWDWLFEGIFPFDTYFIRRRPGNDRPWHGKDKPAYGRTKKIFAEPCDAWKNLCRTFRNGSTSLLLPRDSEKHKRPADEIGLSVRQFRGSKAIWRTKGWFKMKILKRKFFTFLKRWFSRNPHFTRIYAKNYMSCFMSCFLSWNMSWNVVSIRVNILALISESKIPWKASPEMAALFAYIKRGWPDEYGRTDPGTWILWWIWPNT